MKSKPFNREQIQHCLAVIVQLKPSGLSTLARQPAPAVGDPWHRGIAAVRRTILLRNSA